MSDPWTTFAPTFWAELAAALVGGLVTAAVALVLFRQEGNRRDAERIKDAAAVKSQRNEDAAAVQRRENAASAATLQKTRSEAIVQIIDAVHEYLVPVQMNGQTRDPVIRAATFLLLDGTDDSLTIYKWITKRIGDANPPSGASRMNLRQQENDRIRAMLIAWLSPNDSAGVIASIMRELTEDPPESIPTRLM